MMKRFLLIFFSMSVLFSCSKNQETTKIEYYENGRIHRIISYETGKPQLLREIVSYYDNGQIEKEVVYKNNKMFLLIKYYETGIIKYITYSNGFNIDGYGYSFGENANVKGFRHNKDGKKDGIEFVFISDFSDKAKLDEKIGFVIDYDNGNMLQERTVILEN